MAEIIVGHDGGMHVTAGEYYGRRISFIRSFLSVVLSEADSVSCL